MKKYVVLVAAMMMIAGMVSAQEVEGFDSAEIADTLIANVDTVELDPDPEWYVAPLNYDSVMARRNAPRRAAAANCPIDSVRTFNVDSVLESVTVYEYGDTTRTITWAVNSDGTRSGKAKEEYCYIASENKKYGAKYTWDNTTNGWVGVSRGDTIYNSFNKEISRTAYVWINNDWVANTKYTWAYDGSKREIEYLTYKRNTSTNQLELSQGRYREWYNASKTTLDIQYSAYTNNNPTAGKKTESTYDASGNMLTKTYYASYNGGWVASSGSTKEIWEYTGAKKTYYEKHTGSNSGWVKNNKEEWVFNAAGKETLYKKYGVNNNEWAITNQNISGYNEYNNQILVENYTFNKTTGVKTGAKKEEYTLKDNTLLQTLKIQYKWVAASSSWENNIKTVKAFDGSKTIDNCVYNWINGEWIGVYSRTKTTYSGSNPIDVITMSWSADIKDWVNSGRTETEYTGTNKTKETTSIWQNDAWQTTGRTDYHYTNGKNDTTTIYTSDGIVLTPSKRTVNTYNSAGTNIMTHIATWTDNKWTLKSMSRTDIIDHVVDGQRQTLTASWQCGADSAWVGVKKDTALYYAAGKPLYTATYKGWKNNDWVPSSKSEFVYDEKGRSIDEKSYNWNNGWVGNIRNEYGYDANERTNMIATYVGWNNSTNYWIGSSKTEYNFLANGKTESYIVYGWGDVDWVYNYRYSFKYDGAGNEIEQVTETYQTDHWVNKTKYEKEYKSGNQTKNNVYNWLNDNWTFYSRAEKTYDDDAQGKLRREITASWDYHGVVQSFEDKLYFYNVDFPFYTIRFENYDGTLIESYSVQETKTPVYGGAKPSRPADTQYTYSFKGWTPAIVAVTGDAVYTAEYDSVVNRYRITWLNADEVEVDVDSLAYGATPSHEDLVKTNTAEWTYTFVGWEPAITSVTGDATYKAQIDSVRNSYRITWLNADDVEVDVDSLAYGATPSHEDLVKTNTAEWTYMFVGWEPAITSVTGDATYKAQIDSVRNSYRITWLNADEVEVDVDSLAYGATPSHEDLVKTNTAEWTYTFVGWEPAITSVTGDATYKAQIDSVRNSYRITWLNADEVEVDVDSLAYGATPSHEDLVKTNTAEWTYSFVGWTPAITSVTGDATYKAQIDSVRNSYRITWLNADDVEVDVDSLAYGATPSHEDLVKTNTAEWTYTFVGWTPAITSVTGDATYKAQFDSVRNGYLVTFKNDGDTLQSTLVAYGTMPVYGGETPTKQGDAQYSYTFSGWDAELTAVTGEATYNAMFSSTVNTYPVTFKNGDDILQSTQVAYGSMPEYTGTEPTKQADAQYTYSFNGWDAELVSVTGEATYNATFSSTINNYRITFKNGEDTLQSTLVAYGTMPVYGGETPTKQADVQYSYTFNGWDAELVAVTGETTYNATFSSTVNNYTITWLLDDGTKIDEQSVAYGTTPSHSDAHKDNTAQYTITFVGWDKAFAAVTGDETYTAVFDSVVNRYTVIFYFEDGVTVLDSNEFEYGEMPSTSLIPSLPATPKYTYTFAGWSPELQPVTGNAAYTPVFDSIVNTYTVTFVNYNNMVLQSSQVPYDVVPEYTGETPIKPSSYKYHYVFTGWTPDIVTVTGDARYKAEFEQVLNSYTILFYDEDGLTVLDSVEVKYGEMPETSVIPTKEDDEEYTYTFAGWSPKIVSATKNTSYTATYTATRKTEGLWDVEAAEKAQKVMIDGVIYIRRGGKIYTLDGTEVE